MTLSKTSAIARVRRELPDHWGRIGGVSNPSKMPGFAYGLPALTSCAQGAKLAKIPGSVCASCYATRGNYRYDNVAKAQAARLASLRDPLWVGSFVAVLRRLVALTGAPFFRWHDSGDLQGPWHLAKIHEVCLALPSVQFWLPTKEPRAFVGAKLSPLNLVVRLSAYFEERALTNQHTTSSVTKGDRPLRADGVLCPAPSQGGECQDCRACWTRSVVDVTYHKH